MEKPCRIRDTMDAFFEARGFYRMHVARGPDSIFRSVSAALFGTQRYWEAIEEELDRFRRTDEGVRIFLNGALRHRDVVALSKLYDLHVEIVSTRRDDVVTCHIFPDADGGRDRPADGREVVSSCQESKTKHVLLCFTEPDQYDLIHRASRIEAAGIVQSILYQILYEDVFKQERSYEAAMIMLSEIPEKPVSLDWNFVGTPMEALAAGLIPFPYKVAKVMDPASYRNIEYDTWQKECKALSLETKIGTSKDLQRGTPCWVENLDGSMSAGFVQGPTKDKRILEVYLTCERLCVFVQRKSIFSFPPQEFRSLRRSPTGKKRRIRPLPLTHVPNEDLSQPMDDNFTGSGWLEGFDATVPPPNLYDEHQVHCPGFPQHPCESGHQLILNHGTQCMSPLIPLAPVCIRPNFLPSQGQLVGQPQLNFPPQPVILQPAPLSPMLTVSVPTSPVFSPNQAAFCLISLPSQYWDGSIQPPGTPLPTPGYSGPVFRFDFPGDVVQGVEPQPLQNAFPFPS